jgi:hypothetical protein
MDTKTLIKYRDYSVTANAILLSAIFLQSLVPAFGNIFVLNLVTAVSVILFFGAMDLLILKFIKWITKGKAYQAQIVMQIIFFFAIIAAVTLCL